MPKPLQPFAAFVASQGNDPSTDVSLAALCAYLQFSSADEPLRKELHLAVAGWDAVTNGDWLDGTEAHSVPRRQRVYELLALDEGTADALDAAFPQTGDGSVVISDEFEPWYTDERRAAHEFYWRAYKRHLIDTGWDPDAIPKLDTATSRVVERLSDPTRPQAYQSKGLVVGYVQSGKTANFTGVVAKSIDAGYRLVIILTGTIDLLRKQTQRRLDMELVGIENIFLGVDPDDAELARDIDYFQDEDRVNGKFLRHGFQPSERGFTDIVRLTRHGSDYRSLNAGITALELHKRNKQKPLFDEENLYASDARLAIVKKNASVLRRLVRDLKSIRSHLGEIPTLIIDDESDQASVNTSDPKKWQQGQTERTTINKLISELLGLLPRAQYVGYTATPYANVFIDPSDTEDIFPKDFLLSLERPVNYMGVADFHDLDASFDEEKTVENSNEKAFVRDLRASGPGPAGDAELQAALDAFLLSGALKLYREHLTKGALWFRHHTMLIHESVRTADHRDLADRVRHIWSQAGYMTPTGSSRLSVLLGSDFRAVSVARAPDLPFPKTFEELKPFVGEALGKIHEHGGNPVLVVNGDKDIDQQNLDFEMRSIWRILVGGTKLSRGFTIEGLTISYYRRRTKQADTLMQMGRWFGFRRGYGDLVRLYIGRAEPDGLSTIDLYEAFEAVVRDEEAFRGQLRQYAKLVDGRPQITPRDIPPLVSQHLPTIAPSARNKMFNAELVIRRSPGQPNEPTAFPVDSQAIEANYQRMLPLLRAAADARDLTFPDKTPSGSTKIGGVFKALIGITPAEVLLEALSRLTWLRPGYFSADLAYVEEITAHGVNDWVVIAPQLRDANESLEGLGPRSVFVRKRRPGRDQLFGALSDPKHRPAAACIAGAEASWGDNYVDSLAQPERGAVLLYPLREPASAVAGGKFIVAFTLFAPWSARPLNGQVVQFRAKDKGSPRAAIVTTGTD
ncbi:MAG: Z1 domain-containing protein [Jatrophihabitans sp.]